MRLRKWQRRIGLTLGIAFGGVILLWLSMPLWFPWVLRPVARKQGALFSTYERHGYGHFTVHQATFSNQAVVVRAERIDALVPNVWLWRHLRGTTNGPFVNVNEWQVQVLPIHSSVRASEPSTYTNAQKIAKIVGIVQQWATSALLSNGNVRVQKFNLDLPSVRWVSATIAAELDLPEWKQSGRLYAQAPPKGGTPKVICQLELQSDSLQLHSSIALATNATGLQIESKHLWASNVIQLTGVFAHGGSLPDKASLEATNFQLPSQLAQLKGYQNINGSLAANWAGTNFALNLEAGALPKAEQTNLPPLALTMRAHGDTSHATIESAKISAPWLVAELSQHVEIFFTGKILREPASLNLSGDLAQQPWIPFEGLLNGHAALLPGEGRFPSADFQLAGSNIGDTHLKASSFQVAGLFNWPSLKLDSIKAQFEDDSRFVAKGELDVAHQLLANGTFQFSGSLFQRWLPAGYCYDDLAFAANIQGPLKALVHSGFCEVQNFSAPELQPLTIKVQWGGTQLDIANADISLTASNSALHAKAAFEFGANPNGEVGTPGTPVVSGAASAAKKLTLHALTLQNDGAEVLTLRTPAHLSFAKISKPQFAGLTPTGSGFSSPVTRHPSPFSAALDSFVWTGSAGNIQAEGEISWPAEGKLRFALGSIHSDLFQDFVKPRVEPFELQKLAGSVGWTNGPAVFNLELAAVGAPERGLPLLATARLQGDQNGVAISNLTVTSQTSAVANATGLLPVTFHPGALSNVVSFELTKALDLAVTTKPEAIFWRKLATWTGLVLGDPDCQLNLSGSWLALHGQLRLVARELQYSKGTRELPKMENLRVVVDLERDRARISEAELFVEQQPVTLTGEIPLGEKFWTGVLEKKVPDWKDATGRLRIVDAQLAPFAPLLPKVLAPQGKLDLNLALARGALEGELSITKGRTRPLADLGPLREIDTKLTFSGRTLKLETLTADVGGSTLNASGQADLSGTDWLKGETPPFQFTLRGTNIPLSRQPEALIRSDLDLAITKTNGAPAIISGVAHLRDSFYLRDLRDLIPGRIATAARRPPYFSIQLEPLADWRLAARVTGSRFLKIRSTLFNGDASANLRMEGTLKDPVVLGDVKIDSGMVRFPFASLEVRQGFVTLSSDDPFRPKMLVEASSKKYGYDIKMEASGYVDGPVVQFSSTPPLNSEQIVLLVTAGEIPKGEITLTPQQKAQTVAVFLGRDVLQKFGIGDESEDRLTIQSGEQVSEQGKPTYTVEYKLTRRWSLVGEYDRFNAFNAGLKWRIYSK